MPTLARPEVDVLEGLTTAITRRPAADGRRPPLHGRHRHRRQRDAAHPVQPAREAAHRLAPGVLLQRRLDQRGGCGQVRARRENREGAAQLQHHRRHVPALRRPGHGHRHRPVPAVRRHQVAQRGRDHRPRLHRGRLELPALQRVRLLRPGQADPQVHQEGAGRLPPPRAGQDEDRGHQHDLRGADPADPEVDAVQGPGGDAAARPGVRGPRGHLHHLPGMRRYPAQRGGAVLEDQGHQHRRRVRDADQRPGRLGRRSRRAVGGAAAGRAASAPWTRSPRSAWATSR